MKTNMGTLDRVIRISLAVIIIILWALNVVNGITAIITLVVASVFLLTGLAGFCPLYPLIGVNTKKK